MLAGILSGAMENIRDIRRQLGLTQTEMAKRLGLNQSTISRFENGDLPLDKRTELAIKALAMGPTQQDAAA
jgi:transcriptional regulator with XRE-family HTH domain